MKSITASEIPQKDKFVMSSTSSQTRSLALSATSSNVVTITAKMLWLSLRKGSQNPAVNMLTPEIHCLLVWTNDESEVFRKFKSHLHLFCEDVICTKQLKRNDSLDFGVGSDGYGE